MTKYARYHAKRRRIAISKLPAGCWHAFTVNFSDLEIDHVLNNGNVERKAYGHAAFISHIIRDTRPDTFGPLQVLCKSCHKAKTN